MPFFKFSGAEGSIIVEAASERGAVRAAANALLRPQRMSLREAFEAVNSERCVLVSVDRKRRKANGKGETAAPGGGDFWQEPELPAA